VNPYPRPDPGRVDREGETVSVAPGDPFGPFKAACPICAHDRLRDDFTRTLNEGLVLHWHRCRRCGFTFMNPPLAPTEMKKIYNTPAYWNDGSYVAYLQGETVRVLNSRRRLASLGRYLPGRGRWLDIGCATGSFAVVAQQAGYTVVGIDPAEEMVRRGRDWYDLDLRATTIEEFDVGDGSFDVVSLWGVDSHFFDVRDAFGKIVRWLTPGGHVVFNYQDYDHWIRRLFPQIKQNVNVYYNFTRRSLRMFLPQVGLRLLAEWTEGQMTQLRRITRTLGVGEKLLSRWDSARVLVPTISFYTVVVEKPAPPHLTAAAPGRPEA
jgi:2-polyprenyl-3-methyl-5-hydroxy-6-metoxy-1,4-benzoquinol methylase